MADRPLFVSVLSIATGLLCVAGAVIFTAHRTDYLVAGGFLAGLSIAVGLWHHWRWSWWAGFALLTYQLHWNFTHWRMLNDTDWAEHIWFVTVALWLYFLFLFREYN